MIDKGANPRRICANTNRSLYSVMSSSRNIVHSHPLCWWHLDTYQPRGDWPYCIANDQRVSMDYNIKGEHTVSPIWEWISVWKSTRLVRIWLFAEELLQEFGMLKHQPIPALVGVVWWASKGFRLMSMRILQNENSEIKLEYRLIIFKNLCLQPR